MATIPLPQDSIARASARASAGRTGEMAAQIGGQEIDMGFEYIKKATDAYQSTVYNKVLTEEQEELQRKIDERKQQAFDEEGNPTYGTLESDINGYIEESRKRAMSKIIDPRVRDKFDQSFANFSASQAKMARGESRKQFIDWSRAQYNDNAERYSALAISADPEMVEKHIADFKEMNDEMLFNGVISAQEHQAKESLFRSNTSTERFRNEYQSASSATEQQFKELAVLLDKGLISEDDFAKRKEEIDTATNKSIETLQAELRQDENISEQTKDKLAREIELSFGGIDSEVVKTVQELNKQKKQQITLTKLEAEVDIAAGTMKRDELQRISSSLKEQGFEGYKAALQIEKQYEISEQRGFAKRASDNTVASYVNSKQPIPQNIPTRAVNDYFIAQAEAVGAQSIKDLTPIAKDYYREVPMVRGTFKAILHDSSTEEQLMEGVQAFNDLKRGGNTMPIGGSDSELAIDYEMMSQYVDMNIPAKMAFELINNNKQMLKSERDVLTQGFQEKFFEKDRVKQVLDDAIDYKSIMPFSSAELDDITYAKITDIVRNVYMNSGGDMDLTTSAASEILKSTSIGVTNIGAGGDRVMIDAPEKVLNNVTSDTVKAIYNKEVGALLEGTDLAPDDITIDRHMDAFGPLQFDNSGTQIQQYILKKPNGQPLYKDGVPQVWRLPSREEAALEQYFMENEIPEPIQDKIKTGEKLTETEADIISFKEAQAAYKDATRQISIMSSDERVEGFMGDTYLKTLKQAMDKKQRLKEESNKIDEEVNSYLKSIDGDN